MSFNVSKIPYIFLGILAIITVFTIWNSGVLYIPMVIKDNSHSFMEEKFTKELQNIRKAVRNQRALLEEIACATTEIGARGGFCLTEKEINVGGNYMWDLPAALWLEGNLLSGQDVGDFGAGLGWYGRIWLRKAGTGILYKAEDLEKKAFINSQAVQDALATPQKIKSWEGFDGAGNVEKLSGGFIKYLDLSEPITMDSMYDWVVSLEVGEHIPVFYETAFMDNICAHARKGIVMSWAVEGQGGHFHVNNRNNSYVKEKMELRNFINDLGNETKLRTVASLPHFKNTIMVFRRK